jgi:hypothetical protein
MASGIWYHQNFCCVDDGDLEDARGNALIARKKRFSGGFGNCRLYTGLCLGQRGFVGQVLRRTWKCPIVYKLVHLSDRRKLACTSSISIESESR